MTSSANFGYMIFADSRDYILRFRTYDLYADTGLQSDYRHILIAIPWDRVESYYLREPRKWDSVSLRRTFTWFGPLSTMTDMITFTLLTFIICPMIIGQFVDDPVAYAALFQTCWFVENFWMQVQIIHIIRTPMIPFLQSRASRILLASSFLALLVGTVLPFTSIGDFLGMVPMPWEFMVFLPLIGLTYFVAALMVKKVYLRRYGELL